MKQVAPTELQLSLPVQRQVLEPTRQAVLGFLSHWDLSPAVLFKVELVLEETLLNAMLHAFTDDAPHVIDFRAQVSDDDVALHFTDDGLAFDPTRAPDPVRPVSIEHATPGGLGLLLVRKLARSVDYQRLDGRNRLSIRVARR